MKGLADVGAAAGDILAGRLGEYMNRRERTLRHLRLELAKLRAAHFSKAPLYTLAWYQREIERLEAMPKELS